MTLIDTYPSSRKDYDMSNVNILLRSTEAALSRQPPGTH